MDEDIQKPVALKPLAALNHAISVLTLPLLIFLVCLILAAFLYAAINDIPLPFDLDSIIDWDKIF